VGYTGTLLDGKVFDQSEQTAMPVDGVVPGFSEALQLMKRGGEYQLFIPPALGYGDKVPEGGPIPPNSVLIFNVKLIDFKSRAEIMAMQQQMHQMQGEGMHP
jgi:FKBP-type peptidyl-prolyl cis-trans isomerase FkpA